MYIAFILFAWFIHVATSLQIDYGSLVITRNGPIRGLRKTSDSGRIYNSFTGIPYAKPPIGELRFKDPQPANVWKDILDATSEPSVCMQRNYLFSVNPTIEGQEDCLYLNVYVPTKIKKSFLTNGLFPVMVFIHWGGFFAGRSTTGYLGPEYLMSMDVILVTFNYRLGPFGFLSTTDDEAPGNYALKDQVLALRWVQDNIQAFGGDRNNVTIFGQSAGSGSVHYHLLSPLSEGLFQKAISQSGNALSGWAAPLNVIQNQLAHSQGLLVGCVNTSDSKTLMRCLRSVPPEKIMETQDAFRPFFGNPLSIFGPVVEVKTRRNPNPFITKTPLDYILDGDIRKVPWLTGVVKSDGLVRAGTFIRSRRIREALNKDFENIITNLLLVLSLSTEDPKSLYHNVSNFYFGGKEYIDLNDKQTIRGLIDAYSDRGFFYPLYQSLLFHSYNNHTPIYLYSFEYEGDYSYIDLFSGTEENIDFDWGTCHCDDLLYLFNSPELLPCPQSRHDLHMKDIMLNLWVNFARHSVPFISGVSCYKNLSWDPLKIDMHNPDVNSQIKLLNITGNHRSGPELQFTTGFYKERMKFWTDSDIFENVHGLN